MRRMILVLYALHTNGVKTFAWHLCRGLTQAGIAYDLVKLHTRTEPLWRKYVEGVTYRNVSRSELLRITDGNPTLIVHPYRCEDVTEELTAKRSARAVIHSNTKGDTECLSLRGTNPIVIHRSLRQRVPHSVFLPHPYARRFARSFTTQELGARKHAVSITRLDPSKGTGLVISAIQSGISIDLYGELMPFYGMRLDYQFPRWRDSWQGKFLLGEGARICSSYRYMIDLTNRREESGTQYTFFEAADAGTTPVLHRRWVGEEMIAGENCVVVQDWRDLRELPERSPIRASRLRDLLEDHEATTVARRWWRELSR